MNEAVFFQFPTFDEEPCALEDQEYVGTAGKQEWVGTFGLFERAGMQEGPCSVQSRPFAESKLEHELGFSLLELIPSLSPVRKTGQWNPQCNESTGS
jgi:hypothetical protein